jgi:hypothetical protein
VKGVKGCRDVLADVSWTWRPKGAHVRYSSATDAPGF